jgi:hypothetical protein
MLLRGAGVSANEWLISRGMATQARLGSGWVAEIAVGRKIGHSLADTPVR